jgi:hypothetical protein
MVPLRIEMPVMRINEYGPSSFKNESGPYNTYITIAFVVVIVCFYVFSANIEPSATCLQYRTFKINNVPQIKLPPFRPIPFRI